MISINIGHSITEDQKGLHSRYPDTIRPGNLNTVFQYIMYSRGQSILLCSTTLDAAKDQEPAMLYRISDFNNLHHSILF